MTESTVWVDHWRAVNIFGDAFSHLPISNYLKDAYAAAGLYWLAPPISLRWRVPALFVPSKVRRQVDARPVVNELRRKLRGARAHIETMRLSLDMERELLFHGPHDQSYSSLPGNLVEVTYADDMLGPVWSYVYNPHQLALATFNDYENFIDEVMRSHVEPFSQLSRIHQKAKSLHDRVNMVTGAM